MALSSKNMSLRSLVSITRKAQTSCLSQVRYAGGGGRPGGKPSTFRSFIRSFIYAFDILIYSSVFIFRCLVFNEFYFIAFNWKEKRQLRLDAKNKKKDIKFRPFGNFEDIKEMFDESKGDFIVDFDPKKPFQEPSEKMKVEGVVNDKKVIDISKLFGSDKPAGFIPKKRKEHKFFSYKRVFGISKSEHDKIQEIV